MKFVLPILLLAGSAFAQSTDRVTAAEFGRLWGPALDPSGATQVRNFPAGPSYPVSVTPSITAEPGGGLAVSKTARFPVDSSRVIDVTAKAPISKAAMGKALKVAVALGGGPLGIAFYALPEIAEWLTASGMSYDTTTQQIRGPQNDGFCHTVGGCQGYTTNTATPAKRTTAYAACVASVTFPSGHTMEAAGGICTQRNAQGTIVYQFQYFYPVSMPYTAPTIVPIGPGEIEQYGSTPTMKPSWLTRLLETGVPVDAGDSTLTGPASVAGPSSTSIKQIKDSGGNVTGTQTVTNSTTYNITYAGNTYNVNSVNTVTTVNPDGTSTVETTTSPEEPQGGVSDTPMPDLPRLYTKKYPNGLEGVWYEKKSQLTASPLLNLISGLMPSVASSGTCPTMVVPLDVGIADFGSHDFAPPCWIWDFGRVVIIVSALLLARRLIFGG